MGNLISPDAKSWRVSVTGPGDQLTRIRARYTKSQPQTVQISGPRRLECTVEANNARILIEDDGHHVTVLGNENIIVVAGSQTRVRIRGRQNTLTGSAEGTILYSDNEDSTVTVENLDVERESEFSADAPGFLELLESDDNASEDTESYLDTIRISYRARDNGRGDASDNATSANDIDQKSGMKRGLDDDDKSDGPDKRGRFLDIASPSTLVEGKQKEE